MRLASSYRHFYRNVVSRPIIMAIKCAYYIVGVNEGICAATKKILKASFMEAHVPACLAYFLRICS